MKNRDQIENRVRTLTRKYEKKSAEMDSLNLKIHYRKFLELGVNQNSIITEILILNWVLK